jgi:hypothetical protein
MPEAFAEAMHHERLRLYRRELLLAPAGMARARLITLIARENMAAEYHGWPAMADVAPRRRAVSSPRISRRRARREAPGAKSA